MTKPNIGDRGTYRGKPLTVVLVDNDTTCLCRYDDESLGWSMNEYNRRNNLPVGGGYYWVHDTDLTIITPAKQRKFAVGDRVVCIIEDVDYITKGNVYVVAASDADNNRIRLESDDEGDDFVRFSESYFELEYPPESPALAFVKEEMDRLVNSNNCWTTVQLARYGALTEVLAKFGFSHGKVTKYEFTKLG